MESYPNPYSALIATFNQVSPAESPSKDDLDDVQNFPDDDLLLWANAQFTFDIPPEDGTYDQDLSLKLGNSGLSTEQHQQQSQHAHDPQLQRHRQLLIQKQQQLLSLQFQQQQLQQQQQHHQQQQQPSIQQSLQYRPQLPHQQHSFHHVESADPRTLSVLERSRQRNPVQQIASNPVASGTESGFHAQTQQQQQPHPQQSVHYHQGMVDLYGAGDTILTEGQQTANLLPLAHRGFPTASAAHVTPNAGRPLQHPTVPSPHGTTQQASSDAAIEAVALSPKSETGNMSLANLHITTSSTSTTSQPPTASAATLPVTTPIDENAAFELTLGGGDSSGDEEDSDGEGATKSGGDQTSAPGQRRSTLTKGSLSKDDPEYAAKLAAEEDKRRRNTAASARFRQKKRLREQALERTAKEMTLKSETLEARVKELEMEIKWLRGLIIEKDSRMLENMPPIKAIVAASGGNDDANGLEGGSSGNKRGAPAGGPSSSASNVDIGASGRKATSRRAKAT